VCAIFLKYGDELVEMVEQPYEAEDVLQQLLADYPTLLAGDQDSEGRKRWLLVKRELGVASEEGAPDRWSLDHLFLDEEGVPTLIEVKRSSDTRIRREVVGQMLDYAANGAELWGLEKIRAAFESRYQDVEAAAQALAEFLRAAEEPERYWERVGVNLRAGKLRLIFVADVIPAELRRVVEFLNEQMERTEVLALEVRQYVEEGGDRVTLVPRLIGRTEAARQTKGAGLSRPRRRWTEAELLEAIRESNQPEVAARMISLYEWMKGEGARASGGTGATTPSVSLWLGEDADPSRSNPVSVQIVPDSITIPFGYLVDKRPEAELARLAALARKLPGVTPYIEDLEARNYRHWRGMRPEEVLGSDEALDAWKRMLLEATRAARAPSDGDSSHEEL
jgi:hypothetical protein